MITWLTLALAAPLPPGVDPDDLDTWEALADRALDGPPGCWDLSGELTLTTTIQQKATFFRRASGEPVVRRGTFEGRLRDGEWTRFLYDLPQEEGVEVELPFRPTLGRMAPGISRPAVVPDEAGRSAELRVESSGLEQSDDDAKSLMREAMSAWQTSTGVAHAQWRTDLGAIELVELVPLEDGRPDTIQRTTIFPDGGAFPSRVSVTFPRHTALGSWPLKVHVYDAQIHLLQRRVDAQVFPAAESISLMASFLGFTGGFEQRLDYRTATPCGDRP